MTNADVVTVCAADSAAISAAAALIRAGRLVAFPTETVYGLGADATNGRAVASIFVAKGRPHFNPLIVHVKDAEQAHEFAVFSSLAEELTQAFWPGALTLVLSRHPAVPIEVSATETVAVRIPDLDLARALLRLTGPLAVTSANRSSGPNPRTAQEVLAQLEGRIDAILDGGSTPGGVPSSVLDCTQAAPRILRKGAIADQIEAFLRETM